MTPETTENSPETGGFPPLVVGRWLLVCCAMVAAMVVLGGATRLTESGLSIVDWRPVTGLFPPFNTADWQALFDAPFQQPPPHQKPLPAAVVVRLKNAV